MANDKGPNFLRRSSRMYYFQLSAPKNWRKMSIRQRMGKRQFFFFIDSGKVEPIDFVGILIALAGFYLVYRFGALIYGLLFF